MKDENGEFVFAYLPKAKTGRPAGFRHPHATRVRMKQAQRARRAKEAGDRMPAFLRVMYPN
jgi:hypothetical protein